MVLVEIISTPGQRIPSLFLQRKPLGGGFEAFFMHFVSAIEDPRSTVRKFCNYRISKKKTRK